MVDGRWVSQVPIDFLPPRAPLSRGAFFAGNNRLILSNRKPAPTKAQATRGTGQIKTCRKFFGELAPAKILSGARR
jgi:hypothetical protein